MEVPMEMHGVWPRTPADRSQRPETPSSRQSLLLDLRGCDYGLSSTGTWINRATIGRLGNKADAIVPSSVTFDDKERAFAFSKGGDVIRVPLATNPQALKEVTYSVWVKKRRACANLGWILCQYPDYGWSRAVTMNDYRLGHVSVTTSQYWDSKLGQAPLDEWMHVVGIYHSDGTASVYMNGHRGETTTAKNGKCANYSDEELVIGGRSSHDAAHNSALLIADVCVFGRALSNEEVQLLYSQGRATEALEHGRLVLTELSLNTLGCIEQPIEKRVSKPDIDGQPMWDERTKLFWCNTGVDAHDLPEGGKWQHEFRSALEDANPAVSDRVLSRNTSDPPPSKGRFLVRNSSDPDKRAKRAAHTDALRRMAQPAGVELRMLGRNVALFRFDGRVFAVDSRCPHQGASLCEGEIGDIEDLVEGHRFYVRCKVHKFQFDLVSGSVIDGTCPPLRIYNARVRERSSEYGKTTATIEVGFETLPSDYFEPDSDVDF